MSHWVNPIAPPGVYFNSRGNMQPTFNQNLFEQVLSNGNLKRAWTQVRANKGAPGIDGLNKELESRGHKFARYADDFIILVKSKRSGERVLASITRYLELRLKLVVNIEKSRVVKTSQAMFLGFTFKHGNIQWHPKTLNSSKQEIRKLTNRNWGVSMRYQISKLSQYLRGWINYYGITNAHQQCVNLDV